MSKAIVVARVLLGLAFLVFGLNGFLHFWAPPPPADAHVAEVAGALMNSGFIFPIMSFFEVVAAILLLIGRFVPLALLLLAPILVEIVAFHVVLDPKGIGLGLFLALIACFIAWANRAAFAPLFQRPASGAR
ncbi:MAG TPA: DoxX family membrane protein [Polyangiaceae bacterium]|nr:DoxX family membrane protein [Polyangiaceae bacterium]